MESLFPDPGLTIVCGRDRVLARALPHSPPCLEESTPWRRVQYGASLGAARGHVCAERVGGVSYLTTDSTSKYTGQVVPGVGDI